MQYKDAELASEDSRAENKIGEEVLPQCARDDRRERTRTTASSRTQHFQPSNSCDAEDCSVTAAGLLTKCINTLLRRPKSARMAFLVQLICFVDLSLIERCNPSRSSANKIA